MNDRAEAGSCFCGAIIAEIQGDPFWICYDHDSDCRRAIGSPVVVWVGYRPEQFHITQGKPKSFSRTRGVTRTFCPDCGTSIGYEDRGTPNELYIALGFLHHPERFPPQAHAYWCEKLPWISFADKLPRIDGYSRERDAEHGTPADRARGHTK
ncbi:MAG: GFA family protein [Sinobacteraceae bacterium]|nr:GFA family protein [Nevskiaceae bacterium]